MKIELYFDGGSKGNGSRNEGYGSLALFVNGERRPLTFTIDNKEVKKDQLTFNWPETTNNAAELKTAIMAITYWDALEKRSDKYIPAMWYTDSQLVANLAEKLPKEMADHLAEYYFQIRTWLEEHPHVTLKWMHNKEIKKILGH